MSGWPVDDLAALAGRDELRLASRRPDRTLRPFVRIWFVEVGGALFVRSAHGPGNGWYRRAAAAGVGSIQVPGWQHDIRFEAPPPELAGEVSEAYRSKYGRYPPKVVATVLSPDAEACTLRLDPA